MSDRAIEPAGEEEFEGNNLAHSETKRLKKARKELYMEPIAAISNFLS